jgi:hypothetical protein
LPVPCHFFLRLKLGGRPAAAMVGLWPTGFPDGVLKNSRARPKSP